MGYFSWKGPAVMQCECLASSVLAKLKGVVKGVVQTPLNH